ncbi:GAF domain-containing protein [Fusibacter tunisiensis]|uniref:GAF domain-containing protein n=1 Tax=Fusibacter tunisiensis TaxID=1008308 RepID=A0ABS2MSN4_9FIRM|nr:GAF domain-containing protein [Fusibacter tunisiensis]MBM7562370.1 GAF domain-containing protein [Fusibacter tunisiensis]
MACMYPAPSKAPEILYPYIMDEMKKLFETESDPIANAANAAATLGFLLNDLNWAGFYLLKNDELVLGPFWGRPAVTRIKMGSGVCGSAAEKRETLIVPDVHQFPGHIACDLYSNSEIVIPLIKNDTLIGVLDIDSPELDRFKQIDQTYLEEIAKLILEYITF